jgi:signal transduction histidine kinase
MGGSNVLRPRTLAGLTAGACAAVTVVIVTVPSIHLAYREPSLRVALETASVLIALLMALLVHGRARRTRSSNELVLALALVWLAAANLFTTTLVVTELQVTHLRMLSFATGAVGACLIAAAGIVPASALPARRTLTTRLPLAAAALTIVVAAALVPLRHHRLGAAPNPATVHVAHFSAMLLVQVVAMVGFALGAIGFARRAARDDDRFLAWVAVALTVAAFSRLNYVLYPPAQPQWVYAGDGFRVLFHTVLLAAAIREIAGYWRRLAENAVLEERRRLAREIHDSIAQELAYIHRRTAHVRPPDVVSAQIAAAAQRGLDESRRAISALTRPADEPFELALAQELETVAAREGVEVVLNVCAHPHIDHEERDTLIGIAREAVSNAARHGRPKTIHVEIAEGGRVRLLVADDGAGFDDSAVVASIQRGTGFGLPSMRERARALGGEISVNSRPGIGTEVEVVLP